MFGHVSDSASGQVEAGGAGNTGGWSASFPAVESSSQASGSVYSARLATGGQSARQKATACSGNLKASGSVTELRAARIWAGWSALQPERHRDRRGDGQGQRRQQQSQWRPIGHNLGGVVAHAIPRGDVSGGFNSLVGGLVGHNGGELVNADASGRVSAAARRRLAAWSAATPVRSCRRAAAGTSTAAGAAASAAWSARTRSRDASFRPCRKAPSVATTTVSMGGQWRQPGIDRVLRRQRQDRLQASVPLRPGRCAGRREPWGPGRNYVIGEAALRRLPYRLRQHLGGSRQGRSRRTSLPGRGRSRLVWPSSAGAIWRVP